MSETAPLITWMVDALGRESVHRNVPNLSAEQSYIGHLERRKDADGDLSWGFVIKGSYSMAPSYARAHSGLTKAAIASLPVEDTTICGKCPHTAHKGKCDRPMNCSCTG